MSAADFQRANALLNALGPVEAAKLLNDPRDLANFLMSNRLELDESELRELKSNFRA